MRAKDIGERGFLLSVRNMVRLMNDAKLGHDEDASDLPLDNQHVVVNVDTFVRRTDWLPGMTPAQVGRKTAVMTLSDLLVKGASPKATMLSMCMPGDYDVKDAKEIVRGFSQYCLKHDINYLGGDLGMSDDIILTGVGLGTASPDSIITRGGAQDGDIIAVGGYFGLTTLAYQGLLEGLEIDGELKKRVLEAVYHPELSFELISDLREINAITSAMDSSDGLGITLNTMAEHSGHAFVIEDLPLQSDIERFARMNMIHELSVAMNGGEEFIPVFTIPQSKLDEAIALSQEKDTNLIIIGYVQKGAPSVMYESSEGHIKIPAEGYDNLKEWQ